MFTLRTSTMDLDSWVENKYLLIFEINEEALHIEGGAKTCRSKWAPLLHHDWRWKERHRCAFNKISRPLFIISLNPLPLRGKLSAVDFPDLSAPQILCAGLHGEFIAGNREQGGGAHSIPLQWSMVCIKGRPYENILLNFSNFS